MRALNILLSVLVSLAMGLLVFEFGLGRMPAFREQVRLNQFDAQVGWTKKPNHSGRRSTSEFDIHFETNAQGLREPAATPKQKPEDSFRVLLLGDSFVLGYTVEERDVFGSLLEERWRAEGRSIEVLNAGTEGYSTDQEARWLIAEGLDFAPDLVLLFPYENDIYWNGQASYNDSPKPRFSAQGQIEVEALEDPQQTQPWHQTWATGRFLQFLARQLIGTQLGSTRGFEAPGAKGRILNEFGPLLNEQPDFVADCLVRTRGSLLALRDACEQASVALAMAPIPSESAIHADEREAFRSSAQGLQGLPDDLWSPDRPVDAFLALGADLGIPNLDARPRLRAAGQAETLYFREEWHLNPAGNRVLASFLHGELDRLNLVPEPGDGANPIASNAPTEEASGPPTALLVFGALWLFLGSTFCLTYRDEKAPLAFLKVGLMLAFIFTLVLCSGALLKRYPGLATSVALPLLLAFAGFIIYKLGRRLATIMELLQAFTMRGHWYLMPLVVVLLSIGSLLVVAASSPLIAPFIYTLF